jgi:hypothetical protein
MRHGCGSTLTLQGGNQAFLRLQTCRDFLRAFPVHGHRHQVFALIHGPETTVGVMVDAIPAFLLLWQCRGMCVPYSRFFAARRRRIRGQQRASCLRISGDKLEVFRCPSSRVLGIIRPPSHLAQAVDQARPVDPPDRLTVSFHRKSSNQDQPLSFARRLRRWLGAGGAARLGDASMRALNLSISSKARLLSIRSITFEY